VRKLGNGAGGAIPGNMQEFVHSQVCEVDQIHLKNIRLISRNVACVSEYQGCCRLSIIGT